MLVVAEVSQIQKENLILMYPGFIPLKLSLFLLNRIKRTYKANTNLGTIALRRCHTIKFSSY
jgi:hypothetical protein